MIIFLHGPDDFRRERRKKWYIAEFDKKYSGLSRAVFDIAEAGAADELKAFLRGGSLFEPKKLAVVENLCDAEETVLDKELPPLFARLIGDKSTIALFSEKKSPAKKLAFLEEKAEKYEEFKYLSGSEWLAFVKSEAKRRGARPDEGAAKLLAGIYQWNTWGLETELEKLAGCKGAVSLKVLESLDLELLPDYWSVFNGLRSADLNKRLWALEKMFCKNEPAPKIFNILASQWREKIPQFAAYDLAVKSGKLEYEEILLDLAIG